MVAAVSPHYNNAEETLGTLRYALRAKSIVNKVRQNESKSSKLMREMKENMARMQALVASGDAGPNKEAVRAKMEADLETELKKIREIASNQQALTEKHAMMKQKLKEIKEQEEKLKHEQEKFDAEQKLAEERYLFERQRTFSNAFRNAYHVKSANAQHDKEVRENKEKQDKLQKQYTKNEEQAQQTRRKRDELKTSVANLRKESKQQEYKLGQVSDQLADFTKRAEQHEIEAESSAKKLAAQNEETLQTIARLDASVKNALHEREVATDLLNKRQAELRRARQNQDMDLMSLNSKYELKHRELSAYVDGLTEQEERMTRTVKELTETAANYEHQVRTLCTALDNQERELETSRAEARHRKLTDQRQFRDVVLEVEIEREGHKDLLQDGRSVINKIRAVEDRLLMCQKFATHRAGESAVRAWLTSLCLEEYIDKFHKTGVSDLDLVTKVDDSLLRTMRVLPGHRRKYLAAAQRLGDQLQMEPSMLHSSVSMAELLVGIYTWLEELSFAVSGVKAPTATLPSSMSPGRLEAERHSLFGQEKGNDGLWRSPTPPALRSFTPTQRGVNVVQESVLRMINFSTDL
jgi:chromosome segregation ATPase